MARKNVCIGLIIIAMMGLAISERCAMSGENKMPATSITHKHTNRLINESSPYLLQHAHNPVDWFPWGDEAFAKAKRENKPIFLSIGYSTCHWCHVMEVESFENEQIAKIMNENFISIKVDREQRPDVDQVYMNAVMMLTGSGGWPLSVFLTPDGKPFYGGTYFPPHDMYGRPGFERVLLSIASSWKNNRDQLIDSAGKITEFMATAPTESPENNLAPTTIKNAFDNFQNSFDTAYGGFGMAPKFPQPTNLSMLLAYWNRSGDKKALQMVEKTLNAMAKGGIYDHIGGGFHRYATDAKWLIPHFEKMLYDQALLAKAYLQTYQITKTQRYANVATEIFDYVLRDMTDPAGGFYSAEDADSEGQEGTFYLWQPAQIAEILDKEQAQFFNAYYGVTKRGNFEDSKTILNIIFSTEQLAKMFNKDHAQVVDILETARFKVFQHRSKRIRPHQDDKIITAWNGLMISSLAFGGAILQKQKYIIAAEHAADFILNTLHKNNRLMRYYRDGRVIEKAFLNDYAFMIIALLDLYEATFDVKWLTTANQLATEMIDLFADNNQGGFFLTGKDAEKLITRTKPASDGAVPSGNSVAALALLKLGRITMEQRFTEYGTKVLETFSTQMQKSPMYSSAMLIALNFWLGPTQEIVIAGNPDSSNTKQMISLIRESFLPNAIILLHQPAPKGSAIEKLVPFIKNQIPIDNKATAYICQNYICNQPVNTTAELKDLLTKVAK